MPIEIKNLVVKASITGPTSNTRGSFREAGITSDEKQQIIQECVDQVLDILERKKNR